MLNQRCGSERQAEKNDFERRNWENMAALSANLRGNDEGENMPQCSVLPQLSIHWKGLKEAS